MTVQVIKRCKSLGVTFRKNPDGGYGSFRYKFILLTNNGVVGFDYLEDVNLYLDYLVNENYV